MKRLALLAALAASLGACATTAQGIITSDERRIWVVRNGNEMYRCADGATENDPPRPVCIRAVMNQSGQ